MSDDHRDRRDEENTPPAGPAEHRWRAPETGRAGAEPPGRSSSGRGAVSPARRRVSEAAAVADSPPGIPGVGSGGVVRPDEHADEPADGPDG
ncbi:hypothetical protein AB0F36_28210 [Streptomyces sp. NPDC029080]|uniref:hypothetical protein n=1 Tax=Streptomyces sp. NPDC029080 TaxID=3155017 RepID=UPI0033EAEE0C